MKKFKRVLAVLLTTLLFMTMTSVAHLGYAVDQSTVDKLFAVFDDGSNPMYSTDSEELSSGCAVRGPWLQPRHEGPHHDHRRHAERQREEM